MLLKQSREVPVRKYELIKLEMTAQIAECPFQKVEIRVLEILNLKFPLRQCYNTFHISDNIL